MMLKLQTITEELGVICGGRAWVIVTSQADMNAAIGNMDAVDKQDFSKIQGRFDTRLSLSSANVDEVIKKRILAKKPTPEQTLCLLYEQKATIIIERLSYDSLAESYDMDIFTASQSKQDFSKAGEKSCVVASACMPPQPTCRTSTLARCRYGKKGNSPPRPCARVRRG